MAESWFDRSLDKGKPEFSYDREQDSWSRPSTINLDLYTFSHREVTSGQAVAVYVRDVKDVKDESKARNSKRRRGLACLSCFK